MAVKVVVACGSGVATSQTIASKVNRMLQADGVDAEVVAVNFGQVDRALIGAAAYITIIRAKREHPVPVIDGIAFLTGAGQKQQYAKLLEAIKNFQG